MRVCFKSGYSEVTCVCFVTSGKYEPPTTVSASSIVAGYSAPISSELRFVSSYHAASLFGSAYQGMNILLNELLLSTNIDSNKEPRTFVDSPMNCPPLGLLIAGNALDHICSANCWNAHSSNIIKSAVKERTAPGLLGNASNTLSG